MKKEVVFVFMFMLFLVSCSSIYASEDTQVKNAYTCLENRINQTGCSSLNFEEKVFSVLATGKCTSELIAENLSNQCWPKSGCNVKSTAQAILALHEKIDTTKAENWLLEKKATPLGIVWFLEIEAPEGGAMSCDIIYSEKTYKISIGEDKKILPANLGGGLILTKEQYWLQISPTLYNKDIRVVCNKTFITTLLFRKGEEGSTLYVSGDPKGAGAKGGATETVNFYCFADGNSCNYLGSLWAALVLYNLGSKQEIKKFMPYLITMKDEDSNPTYLPESFLYAITDEFRTELLTKQYADWYWQESANKYYDTALALWPFSPEEPLEERRDSKEWLLDVQLKSGCWNEDLRYTLRDTAFLLHSIWPKEGIMDPGECRDADASYCYDVECKEASCKYETCFWDWLTVCDNYDGCCNPVTCNALTDYDCRDSECTTDLQCEDYNSESNPYCLDNTIYKEVSTWTCENEECVENVDEERVERCSNSEYCEDAECVLGGDDTCGLLNLWSCPDGKHCKNGLCVPDTCEQFGCPSGKYCNDNGVCVPETCEEVGCPEISCKESFCGTSGSCSYKFLECADGDSCCNPGCDYSNDDWCEPGPECTFNSSSNLSGCEEDNYNDTEYCIDNDVYMDVYTYNCEDETCIENLTEKLVERCSNTEYCGFGECILEECDSYNPCPLGEYCNDDGECIPEETLDCKDKGYSCILRATCENNEGSILEEYSCSGSLMWCCNTEIELKTCEEGWDGEICEAGEECSIDGTVVPFLDTRPGETCCVEGTCEEEPIISSECIDNKGICTDSCGKCEEENTIYTCDSGTCCVEKDECGGGGKWILIIFLLILISLAVLGIVFRDKLRTQWLKLKDKFGGKKEKKKFEMPLTSHPSPQGRILPRRILPSSQQQSRFPVRRPISSQYPPANRTSQINKKPEEKPKSDLDDVLKKLREMGK